MTVQVPVIGGGSKVHLLWHHHSAMISACVVDFAGSVCNRLAVMMGTPCISIHSPVVERLLFSSRQRSRSHCRLRAIGFCSVCAEAVMFCAVGVSDRFVSLPSQWRLPGVGLISL